MASNPLKWHGGKSYLSQRIINLMPPHTRYVEPYFGGGAVLFRKNPEGVSEYVNDVDWQLINFWRVLQGDDTREELIRVLSMTPLSREEWEYSCRFVADHTSEEYGREYQCVVDAGMFFVRYRQSRQGLGKDFCTPTKRLRRGMNENVSAWLSAVDGLPEAHARLRRVEIRNENAIDVIQELDGPDTLFYCDPPYLHETRSSTGEYTHEMSESDHEEMLWVLGNVEGLFLLSGYRSELYDRMANHFGWRRFDFEIDNKASSKKTKPKKIECVWMNFD
jgi:DNA adenine methylase